MVKWVRQDFGEIASGYTGRPSQLLRVSVAEIRHMVFVHAPKDLEDSVAQTVRLSCCARFVALTTPLLHC